MKVTVNELGPCKKLLRVEEDAAVVDATLARITAEYLRQARFPGFRPGKAPRELVVKRFQTQINEEAEHSLIRKTLDEALREQKLEWVTISQPEEVHFASGQPLSYTITVETAPVFELPPYKGLPAKREVRNIPEEQVTHAIDLLRQDRCVYEPVNRPVQTGDVAVINYAGTCEGKPLDAFDPTARSLGASEKYWLKIAPDQFLPGFSEQLIGAQAGETRQVAVQFPADFAIKGLAGKTAQYQVMVVEVREAKVPAADDQFAKSYGAENMEALRAGVRRDLENDFDYKQKESVRSQVMEALMSRVQVADLPESEVERETRMIVYDIVAENRRRGIPKEVIDQEKDRIYQAAVSAARERVKTAFVLRRIAKQENIEVTKEELAAQITAMANRRNMSPDRLITELKQQEGALDEILQSILARKVMDFLVEHAQIEEVPYGTLSQKPASI